MNMNWEWKNDCFVIYLEGELDHHAARKVLTEMGETLEERVPLHCILDLSQLGFMDSSGIAVILGLDRRVQAYGGELTVKNIQKQPAKVLQAARVGELVSLQELPPQARCSK